MSLTANSSPKSARRKFFMNSTYIMSRKQDQTFLGSGGKNESNSHQLSRIGDWKIFHELDVHHVQKVGIKRFWAVEAELGLTAHKLSPIGEKKIFHELYVHHVQRVGIKRFFAQEAAMSLTANSSPKSARRKFFMNSTYIMSRKQDQTFLGSGGKNESNSHQLSRIGDWKIFHELDVHHV